jgi:hypothetical protein
MKRHSGKKGLKMKTITLLTIAISLVFSLSSFGGTVTGTVKKVSIERVAGAPTLSVLMDDNYTYAFGAEPGNTDDAMITASWLSLLQKAIETTKDASIVYTDGTRIITKITLVNQL